MFVGIGVGVGRQRFAGGFADSYSSRVLSDGGTIESLSCVANASTLLQQASLLFIPSGYKAGVAYSALPNNGNGDLTWTRNSTANRTQSNGNIGSVGANVPRLSYMYGSCPSALLEPQRTNSIRNSTMVGAVSGSPGTLPTNYQAPSTFVGLAREVVGISTENGLNYIDVRYSGTATSSSTLNIEFEQPSAIVASNGQFWSLSYYLRLMNGTSPSLRMTMNERTSAGVSIKFANQNITIDNTLQRYIFSRALDGGATVGLVRVFLDLVIVSGTTYDFTIRIAQPQMELGAYATTPIFTTGTSATRIADTFTRNNIYTNGIISASGGTWYVELKNNVAYLRDSPERFGVGDTSSLDINSIYIGAGTASLRAVIWKAVSGSFSLLYTLPTDNVKIAIKWNGTSADIFANGVKVVSATAFTTTNMQFLARQLSGIPLFIQTMALYNTPLSDSDCITLTT